MFMELADKVEDVDITFSDEYELEDVEDEDDDEQDDEVGDVVAAAAGEDLLFACCCLNAKSTAAPVFRETGRW